MESKKFHYFIYLLFELKEQVNLFLFAFIYLFIYLCELEEHMKEFQYSCMHLLINKCLYLIM